MVGVPFQESISGPETASHRATREIRHCHGGESSRWAKVHVQLRVAASVFPHNKLSYGMNSK
jgi:hypothetical protein